MSDFDKAGLERRIAALPSKSPLRSIGLAMNPVAAGWLSGITAIGDGAATIEQALLQVESLVKTTNRLSTEVWNYTAGVMYPETTQDFGSAFGGLLAIFPWHIDGDQFGTMETNRDNKGNWKYNVRGAATFRHASGAAWSQYSSMLQTHSLLSARFWEYIWVYIAKTAYGISDAKGPVFDLSRRDSKLWTQQPVNFCQQSDMRTLFNAVYEKNSFQLNDAIKRSMFSSLYTGMSIPFIKMLGTKYGPVESTGRMGIFFTGDKIAMPWSAGEYDMGLFDAEFDIKQPLMKWIYDTFKLPPHLNPSKVFSRLWARWLLTDSADFDKELDNIVKAAKNTEPVNEVKTKTKVEEEIVKKDPVTKLEEKPVVVPIEDVTENSNVPSSAYTSAFGLLISMLNERLSATTTDDQEYGIMYQVFDNLSRSDAPGRATFLTEGFSVLGTACMGALPGSRANGDSSMANTAPKIASLNKLCLSCVHEGIDALATLAANYNAKDNLGEVLRIAGLEMMNALRACKELGGGFSNAVNYCRSYLSARFNYANGFSANRVRNAAAELDFSAADVVLRSLIR